MPDDTTISIHYGPTAQVVETLANASTKIANILDDTHNSVRQWEPSAQGMGKDAFEAKFAEWQRLLESAQQAVRSHAGLLDEIGNGYQVFDRNLANRWGSVSY
ncbi:WXG100 family type VII secretion target [Streptomyces sp. TLI_171]|uniref:WXG100 family type VII secretion target n=1 Tax=Streptomyces sp. TLI_171 TaxID=1938859 RepID=UPI000E72D8B1|nr:WXG100 family type VII secretion target [Streptomyces sp. TLI_171]RKE22124.1 uncharacterized protein YukE [Streptomyces sp. TLI_171]